MADTIAAKIEFLVDMDFGSSHDPCGWPFSWPKQAFLQARHAFWAPDSSSPLVNKSLSTSWFSSDLLENLRGCYVTWYISCHIGTNSVPSGDRIALIRRCWRKTSLWRSQIFPGYTWAGMPLCNPAGVSGTANILWLPPPLAKPHPPWLISPETLGCF